ncbi:MAG: hypothetical protein ACRYGF_05995 [Janthinobacterium lividum]
MARTLARYRAILLHTYGLVPAGIRRTRLFTRVTYWKGTKVHRADAPFGYWFSIVFAFVWGVAATAAGIALL